MESKDLSRLNWERKKKAERKKAVKRDRFERAYEKEFKGNY